MGDAEYTKHKLLDSFRRLDGHGRRDAKRVSSLREHLVYFI